METGPIGVLGASVRSRVVVVNRSTLVVVLIPRRQIKDYFVLVKARSHGNVTLTRVEVRDIQLYDECESELRNNERYLSRSEKNSGLYFHCCLSSFHFCEDRPHIHFVIQSSRICFSYIYRHYLYHVSSIINTIMFCKITNKTGSYLDKCRRRSTKFTQA